jgi:hypothetical protein
METYEKLVTSLSHCRTVGEFFYRDLETVIKKLNKQGGEKREVLAFEQEEGDTVFVPSQWAHAVVNVEASVAITHNFVFPDKLFLFLDQLLMEINAHRCNMSLSAYEEYKNILLDRFT